MGPRAKALSANVVTRLLEGWRFSEKAMALPLDEVEREQERRAREVHRIKLELKVAARGQGDVGPVLRVLLSW